MISLDSHRRNQRTIRKSAQVDGFGFWKGRNVRVEFHPAPPDSGLVFVRVDLAERVRIPALVALRIESPRRTTLAVTGGSVAMVEHIIAACAGLQVDNLEIRVDDEEMPGVDGSSQPFVDALLDAGIVEQSAPRRQLVVRDVLRVGNEASWVEARPATDGKLTCQYRLDYGPGPIGCQQFEFMPSPEAFQRELAAARTFLPVEEAEWLRSHGLGTRVDYRDVLVFGKDGPIDNELRFDDECVRHKTLDLVGDLALSGCDLVGHVTAYRSGHRLNAEMVRELLAADREAENDDRKSA